MEIVPITMTCPDCESTERRSGPRMLAKVLENRYCRDCEDTNQEETDRQRAEVDRLEREQKVRERTDKIHTLLLAAGANPWEHGNASFETYDAADSGDKPVALIREFITETKSAGVFDPVRGLYLFGDTGIGKTHLAVAALREFLLDPGWSPSDVVFDHAVSLIAKIQDTYNTGESTQQLLDKRINARVWILDDLGSERASEDVVQRLTLIFTERAMRPTLVTSNDPPDRLEQRHRELKRVQSRLGPAYFRTVRVKGRDRRFDKSEAA